MTQKKLVDTLSFYRTHALKLLSEGAAYPDYLGDNPTGYQHVANMCFDAAQFVEQGRVEKAMRWLGYVQGVLVCRQVFTLDEVKGHSREP